MSTLDSPSVVAVKYAHTLFHTHTMIEHTHTLSHSHIHTHTERGGERESTSTNLAWVDMCGLCGVQEEFGCGSARCMWELQVPPCQTCQHGEVCPFCFLINTFVFMVPLECSLSTHSLFLCSLSSILFFLYVLFFCVSSYDHGHAIFHLVAKNRNRKSQTISIHLACSLERVVHEAEHWNILKCWLEKMKEFQ